MSLKVKFALVMIIATSLLLPVSFYIILKNQEKLIFQQIENEARAITKMIILTRQWIALHDGVLVKKKQGIEPNPHLLKVGMNPLIKDEKGNFLVLKNPALATRELSNLSESSEGWSFRIIGLTPINSNNTPDEYEAKALKTLYETKEIEYSMLINDRGKRFLRYIYPLYVNQECLVCHGKQGYSAGQLIGALSINIPVEKTFLAMQENKKKLIYIFLITFGCMTALVFLMVKTFVSNPLKKIKKTIKEFKEGKIPAYNQIQSRDELEEIWHTFRDMAEKISDYHKELQNKIREATKELETANRKLLELNQRKSDFIASAAHELRTPLTSIKGAVDFLNVAFSSPSDSEINEKINSMLQVIKRNTDRLIRMINDMLDLERIENGIMEFNNSCFDISELIEETVFEINSVSEKSVKFFIDIERLTVFSDRDKIKQVLLNLLSNAVKFSPENGEIKILCKKQNSEALVEISDQGPGISAEIQDKIFYKFFKDKHLGGSGLGLTIAKAIVEAHGGSIGVKSDGKYGSTFYFTLPLKDESIDC